MRIYLTPPTHESRGLQRIADALARYAPEGSEVVDDERAADLVILYAIGRCEALTRQATRIVERGQWYAVLQLCLRSTQKPHVSYWWPLWSRAVQVWSYYNLYQAIIHDGGYPGSLDWSFYHAPLGVDAEVFYPRVKVPEGFYVILSTGLSRLSESVRECYLAAEIVGKPCVHLGAKIATDSDLLCMTDITDDRLAELYTACQFVSGLRRIEGFELPAAEGLLCGARPVVFDTPDYRWNYRDHGEYIPEGARAEVVESLVELFRRGSRPVSAEERQRAAEWFDWKRIVEGFYERCGL